jgi:NAD(P)H-flavin reductase
LQPGDQILMRKVPKGRFSLDMQNGKTNHLLISTVTGVAPFVSMVRTLSKDWKEGRFDGAHKLFLLNGASRPWEFGYLDELAYLCGHPEMIEHSKAILKRRGFVDKGAVKEEVYWIPPHK